MNVDAINCRLAALGISMSVSGERLDLRPGSGVPMELRDEVRRHKLDLLEKLTNQHIDDSELAETEVVPQICTEG